LYGRLSGGGGYGDPLDRDPELVLKDVLAGLVTEKAARDVYGVVVNAGVGVVEKGATGKLRSSFRAERLGGKMPMANTTERAEILRTPRRINEYLQVAGKGEKSFVQCTWCGESICQANASWKDHAVARKSPLTRSGPLRADTDRFFLQEYFCPGCATMLDVEMTLQDDQPLYDEITRWPE
ncbi:MAG: acetone carboxylase subunit gamma, partial [Dehalococcoidia bacterium]|nr:acetone carboxylase subunit gamma [Dehalococcoidia bacterium]